MALTAVGIGLSVAGAASSGYQAKRGHDVKVQASHAQDDEEARQLALQNDLDAREKANKQQKATDIAYQQQRALRAGSQGRSGTIRTGSLGIPSAPKVGGNSYLGAA